MARFAGITPGFSIAAIPPFSMRRSPGPSHPWLGSRIRPSLIRSESVTRCALLEPAAQSFRVHDRGQDGHADQNAVRHLVEHDRARSIRDFGVDLDPP